MTVSIPGLPSVSNRTLFTNRGPIVKKPSLISSGANLYIASETEIVISTGSFNSTVIGKTLTISGSPGGRNDGTFEIADFRNSTTLLLKSANFDRANTASTLASAILLVNDLKAKFNAHINTYDSPPAVHQNPDVANLISFEDAVDLTSASTLANLLLVAYSSHILTVGAPPPVHSIPDTENTVFYPAASTLAELVRLVNELRIRFESHRSSLIYHGARDIENRITVPMVSVVKDSGPLHGPFSWVLEDPRYGQIADDPSDVIVKVNGTPVSVEAVFGLLGAVVLTTKPAPADTVTIDYSWLDNPATQIERLNSPEFSFNQVSGRGLSGFPQHKYRSTSTLVDPAEPQTVRSPYLPKTIGWKYKGLERAYTASLNDPNLLLTNVPNNRVAYPVLVATIPEALIKYDPVTLPENSFDPWTLNGTGTFSLAPGGGELTVTDSDPSTGPGENPPFYSHKADFTFPSTVSAAFRVRITQTTLDGSFTGVGFGIADGTKTALVGFLETNANNLSSAIVLANDIKAKFNLHLTLTGTHLPNDYADAIDVVDAKNLASLVTLVNRIKTLFNTHLNKSAGTVHIITDSGNLITTSDSIDLASAIALTNEIALKFNQHRISTGVHYVNDSTNTVGSVSQVGILTSRGNPEDSASWNSYAVNWDQTATYRLHRDLDGNVSLYISGSISAAATVSHDDLPSTSDISIRINPAQQVFFGAVWRGATSTSGWSFIRANIIPNDYNQLADNKAVLYDADFIPELEPVSPWVTLGQGGTERITTSLPHRLIVDSTSDVPQATVDKLGLTTGEFRGYLRSEPVLSSTTTLAIEFIASASYWTFSLDNRAAGVFIDDELLSTHFVFLQHMPSPATITGTSSQPFPIAASDSIILSIGSAQPIEISFPAPITTVVQVAGVINAAVGFTLVSDDGSGRVKFTDNVFGAASKLVMIGGLALSKIGVAPGTYTGKDSNPEPTVSWFGESLPDEDVNPWVKSGSQVSSMFGRTMEIDDSSVSDYRSYTESDPLYTNPILSPAYDWKLDYRFKVLSFTAGDKILSGSNLRFAGVLLNVDEGPTGKNFEVHTSVDDYGTPYLNILSYDSTTNSLIQQTSFLFAWNDSEFHTINVFTSKGSGLCIVQADAVTLGTFSYAGLNPGFTGPAISFGSGSEAVANGDLRTAISSVVWSSVTVFKDSKIADPLAPSRRYVGIYAGGSPDLLSSYYLHQIDWTSPHTYRIVRDPINGVSVFIDGSSIASISAHYDSLTLPPSSSSFLKEITDARQSIAFGGFDPVEISRTVWGPIKYSLGKMTITDRRIPPHQVLNQGNAYTSPDHLRTIIPHQHAGFKVYSGGTPIDEFMYDERVPSYTVLGEGTAPVPMTQDLESRGGLVRTATQTNGIDPLNYVNFKGYITDLIDDAFNSVDSHSPASGLIAGVNAILQVYNDHLVSPGVHLADDLVNNVALAPVTSISGAITAMNAVASAYSAHRTQVGVHTLNDTTALLTAPIASDVQSLTDLANDFADKFSDHIHFIIPHASSDILNTIVTPNAVDPATLVTLANSLAFRHGAHLVNPGSHVHDDLVNVITSPFSFDTTSAITLLNEVKTKFNSHLSYVESSVTPLGSHKGIDRFNTILTANATDLASAITLANAMKLAYNAHFIQVDSHSILDTVSESFNFADAYAGSTGHSIPVTTSELLAGALLILGDLKSGFNQHLVQRMVHVADDESNIFLSDAVDLPTAIAAANLLKLRFNSHRVAVSSDSGSILHTNDDVTNVVTASDSSDLSSLVILLEDIQNQYNAHLVQSNVHGSTVFIKLDPPPRVRYQGTRFFRFESGEEGLVFPFSDAGGPTMGPLSMSSLHTLSYEGGTIPEFVNLVGYLTEPFGIIAGETMTLTIGSSEYVVTFAPGDTTAALVATRINAVSGVPAGTASDNGDGRVRLEASGSGITILASGVGATKLGLDGAQSASWFILSDDPTAVTATLMTAGPRDFLRYGVVASGTKSAYFAKTGLTDAPSLGYTAKFSIRINSYTVDADGNTGIYVGVSGASGPGYTAAIGFDYVGGTKLVKIQDLKSGVTLFRRAFDWDDGLFHTYELIRRVSPDSIALTII